MMFPRAVKPSSLAWERRNKHDPEKDTATATDWREVLTSGPDGLRQVVQQVVQEVLEAEMDEAVGAQKSERTAERLGYRSGY